MKPQLECQLRRFCVAATIVAIYAFLLGGRAQATNGTWNQTAGSTAYTWTTPTDWNGGVPNAIADTATLNTALAGNQTISLSSANITLGSLALGASTGTFTYLLQTGTFTLNNNGGGAAITELSNTSGGDTINAVIVLADSLSNTIASNSTLSTSTFTIENGVTGTQPLTLAANNAGNIMVESGSINVASVTNSGSGSGTVSITSAFGSNVTTVNQSSSTSVLSLNASNGANTITYNINSGTLTIAGNSNSIGANSTVNFANTAGVTLALGGTGETIGSLTGGGATGGALTYSGGLTLSPGSAVNASFAGSITGNGNVTFSGAGTQTLTGSDNFGGSSITATSGTLVFAGANSLTNYYRVSTSGSGNLIIGAGVTASSTVGAQQQSSGTMTINGSLTFAQGMNGSGLDNGTLAIGSTGSIASGQGITLTSGATLTEASGGNIVNSSLTLAGTGTATLNSSANTFGSGLTVEEGVVRVGANAAATGAGSLGEGSITLGSTTSQALTGAASILTNVGGITIARAISESSSVSNTGGLFIGGSQASGTSTYTGAITLSAATTLTSASGGAVNFNDAIGGAYNLTIGGGGTVALTGTSTFSGGSIIVQGGSTLTANNATAGGNLGTGNQLVFNNGIFQFAAGAGFDLSARTLGFYSGGGTIDTNGNNVTFASAIGAGGTGSFTGGLTLADSSNTPGSLTLTAINTYTGGTTVTSGTLVTTGAGTLGSTGGALTVNTNGKLDLHSTNQTVGSLSGSGGYIFNNYTTSPTTSTLTIGNNFTGSSTYAGVIENNTGSGGTMALYKTGTGTIGLTGANTYTGATTVNQGTLIVSGTGSLGGTAVTVNSGGTLQIGLSGSTLTTTIGTSGAGSLDLNNGTLSFANGVNGSPDTAIKDLDINSNSNAATALSLTSGTLNIGVGGAGGSDEIVLGGTGSGLVTSLSGTITVNLNVVTALNGTAQELIAYGSGGTSGSGSYVLGTIGGVGAGGYSLSLVSNSTGLFLDESATSTAYWKGGVDSSWATGLPGGSSNFTTDSAGTINRTASLDNQTSVVFIASGGANYANTTLDGSPTINNLTYNVGGVGIANGSGGAGSGNVLTIAGATGIMVNAGLGAVTETISANVALGQSQTWTVSDAASTLAVSGNISGPGYNLVKAGSGTLVLSGVNSYSGATTVAAGYLNIQSSDALDGTAGVIVNTGGALQIGGGSTTNNATNLTINGTGPGTGGALESVDASGNSYTGSISLGSASSIGSDAGLFSLTGTDITTNGYTLTLVGAGDGYISNAIGGSGGLTMSGTGIWTLDGVNTYTGTTTVNSGTLQLGDSGNGTFGAQTNTLAMNGGTVDVNGYALTIGNLTGSSGTITNSNPFEVALNLGTNTNSSFGGTIADGGGVLNLYKEGTGTQTLTGSNTYSGPTTVSAGALNIAGSNALSANSSVTVASGAALQLSGGVTAGAASLSLTGTGINGGALENVSGANTYTGPISLAGATSISSDAGLLTLSTATITGSSLNLTLVGAGNGVISDVIATGGGGVTMSGTGTWTLSGSNSYTGATSITDGTLVYTKGAAIRNSSSINIGTSTPGASAALDYDGAGATVSTPINFSGTDTITLGNIGTGSITYSGPLAFAANNTTLVLGNATDTIGGSIGGIANGAGYTTNLIKQGAANSTWILTGSNPYTGTTAINGGVLQVASQSVLGSGNLVMQGTSTDPAILQTTGTFTMNEGTGAGQFQWQSYSGFASSSGTLTLDINSGGNLIWGSQNYGTNSGGGTNLGGVGGAFATFGSNSAAGTILLSNNINFNSTDPYQQNIYVQGVNETLVASGFFTDGTGTASASGLNKIGSGTLVLTNGNSTYSGATSIVGGTLVAEASSTITVADSTSTSSGVFGSGNGQSGAPAPATYVPIVLGAPVSNGGSTFGGVISPTLLVGSPAVGGSTSISNPVNVDWNNGTGQVYGMGGYTDSNNTFAGLITLNGTPATGNTFAITQVATTGSDALNITGGITASNAVTGTINFANVGAVNVNTTGISNGSGASAIFVSQTGSGTTTFAAANTYTGATTISAGTLRINGSTALGSAFTVQSGGTLGGTGTINGSVTVNGGGAINLEDGTIGTLKVGSLTLGAGSTALSFDIGAGSSNNLDSISNLGTLTTNGSSTITIGFVSGTPALMAGTYTLISGPITMTQYNTFTLTDSSLGAYTLALVDGGASGLELQVIAPITTYYYTGATSTDFTDYHNFNTGASTGTVQTVALSSTSDVTIGTTSPTPANLTPVANSNISIDSLTFASSGAGATLSGTGTVSIAAAGGTGITDNAGVSADTETVSTAVALGANQSWAASANSTLNVSGPISGAHSLALTGAGTYKLGGANTFQGLTVGTGSDTPAVFLTNGSNGSATGTTTLTVNAGATLGGSGTSSGTSFSIVGTGTAANARANILVGMNSAGDANTSQALTLVGSGASSIQYANLAFNLNARQAGALGSDPSGSGTELAVGNTAISFGTTQGSVKLTLNMQNQPAIVAAYTPYVLIAGTSATTDSGGVSGGQYTGLTLGNVINLGNGATETLITGDNLTLAFSGSVDQAYYGANSYLVLYQSAGVDDIDVEVVPEPGTWALMLGGLALLIFWQRRKLRRQD